LWGIGPFAEASGFRVEYIPAGTNAEMQRNIEIGTLGYQSPAVMAEQNVTNVKIVAGEQLGGQNLIMRKGVELNSWKDLEGKRLGRPPGSYVAILFTLAAKENGVDLSRVSLLTPPRPDRPAVWRPRRTPIGLAHIPVIDQAR
jgi:ABC-type nitrate/sulfonate/bicarbonate transport system substrate-binding protein